MRALVYAECYNDAGYSKSQGLRFSSLDFFYRGSTLVGSENPGKEGGTLVASGDVKKQCFQFPREAEMPENWDDEDTDAALVIPEIAGMR